MGWLKVKKHCSQFVFYTIAKMSSKIRNVLFVIILLPSPFS
nr:MAG TPA: hypothetical protein [Caudoviricetes sp.]